MSLEYHLTPDREARLRATAKERGTDPTTILDEFLDTLPLTDDSSEEEDPNALERAIQAALNLSPEERKAMRERVLASAAPAIDPPEGQTWLDAISGKWHGDETDEEILKALKRLS